MSASLTSLRHRRPSTPAVALSNCRWRPRSTGLGCRPGRSPRTRPGRGGTGFAAAVHLSEAGELRHRTGPLSRGTRRGGRRDGRHDHGAASPPGIPPTGCGLTRGHVGVAPSSGSPTAECRVGHRSDSGDDLARGAPATSGPAHPPDRVLRVTAVQALALGLGFQAVVLLVGGSAPGGPERQPGLPAQFGHDLMTYLAGRSPSTCT
jgi:hypothetical protein